MARPVILVLAAVPAIIALVISVPLLTRTEIPVNAANYLDVIDIQYTLHEIGPVSSGDTGFVKSEVLVIDNGGAATYTLIDGGVTHPEKAFELDDDVMRKLAAFIKETGIISIPAESFVISDDTGTYKKSVLSVTLNDQSRQIRWPEQNATTDFVPPLLTQLGLELDAVLDVAR